jgi:hypothetical protein
MPEVAPSNYIELDLIIEGYSASIFNDKLLDYLKAGLKNFIIGNVRTDAMSIQQDDRENNEEDTNGVFEYYNDSSNSNDTSFAPTSTPTSTYAPIPSTTVITSYGDDLTIIIRSISDDSHLKDYEWGACELLIYIEINKTTEAFVKFMNVYKAHGSENAGTQQLITAFQDAGLPRVRSTMVQEVTSFQNGDEIAHIGSNKSNNKMSTLLISIISACAALVIVVIILAVRVITKRAHRAPRTESGAYIEKQLASRSAQMP